ncbi:hypothetical protein [Bacillus cereus]|uniref:Uncharacterized protein n=1 Tax=Bacillus cereus TaxID=1396 RepID=A0A9X6UJP7_BACCE|nr:hypothetical protein [Bacillus cereus]PEQ83396.1 hypothetical protein CN475_22915 [Bacillus cereus]
MIGVVALFFGMLCIGAMVFNQCSYGKRMFSKEISNWKRIGYVLWFVIGGAMFLMYLSIYVAMADTLNITWLKKNLVWCFFFAIILTSIIPIIVIYSFRRERFIFDILKTIINSLAIISTVGLFVIKVFGVYTHPVLEFSLPAIVNDIGGTILQTFPFAVYPCVIAFAIGEYFVKQEQWKQEKQKEKGKKTG